MNDDEERLLGIRVVKAFPDLFKDARKHDAAPYPDNTYKCGKCNKSWPQKGNDPCTIDKWKCTVPTTVDVNDWNLAHKLADYVIAKFGVTVFLEELARVGTSHTAKFKLSYVIAKATPTDYIKAACMTKEGE